MKRGICLSKEEMEILNKRIENSLRIDPVNLPKYESFTLKLADADGLSEIRNYDQSRMDSISGGEIYTFEPSRSNFESKKFYKKLEKEIEKLRVENLKLESIIEQYQDSELKMIDEMESYHKQTSHIQTFYDQFVIIFEDFHSSLLNDLTGPLEQTPKQNFEKCLKTLLDSMKHREKNYFSNSLK